MTAFSPFAAALEGVSVIRREPKAVLGWTAVWMLVFVVNVAIQRFDTAPHAAESGVMGLLRRFGPLWPVVVVSLFLLWMMTTASIFRAVIKPDEHGWHLFRLGVDERRLMVLTIAAFMLIVALGSVPAAILLYVLFEPVLAVMPAFGKYTVAGGTLVTVVLEGWMALRLSLSAVHTFAEGRFHFLGYWQLTRGWAWTLFSIYFLVGLEILVVIAVIFGLAIPLIGLATSALGAPVGPDLLRRILLLSLALTTAFILAVLFVVPIIIFCASQAYAYRHIVAHQPVD